MGRPRVRLAACSGLAAAGWAAAALGDGSSQWFTMVLALWCASGAVVAYPHVAPRRAAWGRRRRRRASVSELHQNRLSAFWMAAEGRVPRVRRFREAYADLLRRVGSGLPYDHDLHAARAVHASLSTAPSPAVLAAAGEPAAAAIACAAPAAAMLYPLLQLWGRVRQHAVQVEEEMAFFLCFFATMQGVGYSLYAALDRVRDAGDVFAAMSRDAAAVARSVALGTPHAEALRLYASRHPVRPFRDFLYGCISKHETVGPVPAYAEAKSAQFFESYRESWNNYKATAAVMAAMAVAVSVMIPTMMVMMVFIAPPATVNLVLAAGPAMGPALAAVLLFVVSSSQPSTGVRVKPWLPALGVAAAAAAAAQALWMQDGRGFWDAEPGVAVSLGFAAGGLANHIAVRRRLGGASGVERALPEFLEDVGEQTMAGSSITAILRRQARAGAYSGLFGRLLRGAVSRMEAGATLEEACRDARRHSRYLSFVLFIIIRLQELGPTSPTALVQMTRFMSGIVSAKADVVKSLRMGAVVIYVSPAMLVGTMTGMLAVFEGGGEPAAAITGMLPPGMMEGLRPPDPDSDYRQRLGLMAALLTCPMGLVAAKITRFTAAYTAPVAVVGAVSAASLLLAPAVAAVLSP